MASAKKVSKKTPVASRTRRMKDPAYRSFRLHRKIRPTGKVSSSRLLTRKSLMLLRKNWKMGLGLMTIYAVTTLILVRGFGSAVDTVELKDAVREVFPGNWSGIVSAGVIFSSLLSSTNGQSAAGGVNYGQLVTIINSLACLWALRQISAKNTFRLRDAYYKGVYPLVPFLLVLIVIAIQLLPLSVGVWLYGTVISNFIAVTVLEKVLWFLIFSLLGLLSFYMVSSSIFALLIVSLPDMTPMKALRSARQLVLHRRWIVMRKILFLPILVLMLVSIVLLPFLIWLPAVTEWLYFALSCFSLVFSITYIYQLYRDLLHE